MDTPTEQDSRLTMNALEEAASKPDVDPCDVACDAMPARVVGDLSDHDVSWLLEHTDDCNYCANELKRYDRLGEALTAVGTIDAESCQPPAVALPRLLDLVRSGALELASLVGPSFPLDRADDAFQASLAGSPGRVLVTP